MADPALKEKAKELFVEKGLSIESILTMLNGVSRKTLYNWRNEEDWDNLRVSRVQRKINLRDRLEALLERAITEAETNLTANNLFAVGKAMEAIRKATYVDFSDEKSEADADVKKGLSPERVKEIEEKFGVMS